MSDTNDNPNDIPRLSTPTWQMELLVSGGVIIAVWQTLALVDAAMAQGLSPLKQIGVFTPIFYLYPYAALLAIGIAFTIHLALRALWIAVVGIHSVFPDGIRWDNYQGSAKTAERMRQLFSKPAHLVEKLDNFSTIVYALGIAIATMMLGVLIVMTVMKVLVQLIQWGLFPETSEFRIFALVGLPMVGLILAAQFVDSGLSKWIPQQSWLAKSARAIILFNMRLFAPSSVSYLLTIISSNFGRWAGAIGVYGLMLTALLLAGARMFAQRGIMFSGQSEIVQQAATTSMYSQTRGPNATWVSPYIDALQTAKPYVPLHIPYRFRYFEEIAERICKRSFEPRLQQDMLACVRQGIVIKLDQQQLLCPLDLFAHQKNDTYSLYCMIDARSLAIGRHELTVQIMPRVEKDKPETYTIPFWR
jgi:hypothetical protein